MTMKIADPDNSHVLDEFDVIFAELPLLNATVLELGCGKAEKTRKIAATGKVAAIVAMEVDEIQHGKNLQNGDLHNVTFRRGAAEAIPVDDASFDIVMMFKSLHHVPTDKMDAAFKEIHRVLKPGGWAWISEPVYAGAFNEVIRLFHDEMQVREAAFAATQRAVANGRFQVGTTTFLFRGQPFSGFQSVRGAGHSRHPHEPSPCAGTARCCPAGVRDAHDPSRRSFP